MTVGGTHTTSQVSVAKGIGWKNAREIWFMSMTSVGPQTTFTQAALAQLSEAARRGPEVLQAVGCAWIAVGVFDNTRSIDPRLALLACPGGAAPGPAPAPPPGAAPGPNEASSCAGRTDAIVCNETAPVSAYVCKNGGIIGAALCADLAQHCKHPSPSDWTAKLNPAGQLICE